MTLTPQSEAAWLRGLSSTDRARFLVRLAHNLTVTGRGTRPEHLRNLNEIQHRILGYACYALGPKEDVVWLPIVAKYVLEPRDETLRDALSRDWIEARKRYTDVP